MLSRQLNAHVPFLFIVPEHEKKILRKIIFYHTRTHTHTHAICDWHMGRIRSVYDIENRSFTFFSIVFCAAKTFSHSQSRCSVVFLLASLHTEQYTDFKLSSQTP